MTMKLKSLTRFPANLVGGDGITITNSGGTYTFDADPTFFGGDFIGPAVATANGVVRFSGTTGKIGKSTNVVISDTDGVSGVTTLSMTGALTYGGVALTASVTGTGKMVLDTAPTMSAAILTGTTNLSGGQIKFPASQSASADANTLDDYEEGTWTPANAAVTLVNNVAATYTKIGRAVFIAFDITWPSTANGAAATITGLPFASGNNIGTIALSLTTLGSLVTFTLSGSTLVPYNLSASSRANSDLSTHRFIGGGHYTV